MSTNGHGSGCEAGTGWIRRTADSLKAGALLHSRMESVGAWLPERRVSSRDVVALCAQAGEVDLQGITGIVERRMAAADEDSFTLALSAARDCLAHSAHRAEDLDLLMFCGISKYHGGVGTLRFEPSFSVMLAHALGARRAMTFDLSNACAGMMTGVHVLDDFVRRGIVRCGMVVSGEFITHLATNAARVVSDGRHPQAASLTLGDAGAAVILDRATEAGRGIASSVFATLAEHVELCTGWPCPDGPGGHMLTRAKEIHEHAILGTPFIVSRTLDHCGLTLDDIDHVITHQTAVRAIEKCSAFTTACLGSTRPNWIVNVDRCGNTASTTHFVALRRCLAEGSFRRGERVLLVAQASGLVIGAVVLTVDELADRYAHAH